MPSFRTVFWPVSFALLLSSYIYHATASVGVLDIDELLHAEEQQLLTSPNPNSPYSPWSHKPFCTQSTSLKSLGQKFCVYTSNTTGPNGLSLVASPAAARLATKYLDDNPLENFLTVPEAEALFFNPAPYKIVDIPGKGKGVVATRRIKQFETFMVDQAAIVMDMALEKSITSKENLKLLKVGVEQLRVPEVVRSLSAKHGGGDKFGRDDLEGLDGKEEEDVMMTNSFGSTIADTPSRALFPLISRINHACNPNAFVLFSRAGISMAIKAYREIQPRDEITISYLTLGQPFQKRQELLKKWGFKCTCSLCSQSSPLRAQSDARRVLIEEAEKKIIELWKAGQINAAISLTKESIEMIKEEDIWPMLTDEYAMLAKLYLLLDDREKAEEYGKMSFELLGELGFLGVGEEREEWDLEKLLGMIGQRGMYN